MTSFAISMAWRLFLVGMFAVSGLLPALAGEEKPEITIESPSPDGRFAFRETFTQDRRTVDLIEKGTGKLLCPVAVSEEGGNRLSVLVKWAPDSKRFAAGCSTSRLSASISVFVNNGNSFHEVEIPTLSDPEIPAKYDKDQRLHHWAAIGWWAPVRWRKDGAIEVCGESTYDGNSNYVTATRTVVLAPNKAGEWKTASSKQKVTAHFE